MALSAASRLALAGMAGLAALTLAQWLRTGLSDPGPLVSTLLGVMPSLTAAYAMPLIVASWLPSVTASPRTPAAWWRFVLILAATTAGLLGWEVVQATSARLVFDPADLAATLLGAIAAVPTFRAVAWWR